uniref:Uncharacterized protein n=1 Tax=Arundo donax TaxID=35708 RepID=A0A0A8Y2S0_ARUDO
MLLSQIGNNKLFFIANPPLVHTSLKWRSSASSAAPLG